VSSPIFISYYVAPNYALAYEFATRQWIDLFTDWEHEIERLASQIGDILRKGHRNRRSREERSSAGYPVQLSHRG
jgi:hypothetical protein